MKRKVIGIFLMLSLLTGCSGTSEQKVPKLLDNKSVIAATWTVQRGTISNTKTGVGVGTYKMDSYSFKTAGDVSEIFVKIGDTVKKGQLLAKRDTKEVDATIRDLKSDISYQETNNKYSLELLEGDKSAQGKETYRYTNQKQQSDLANLREKLSLAEKEKKDHLIYSKINGEVAFVRELSGKTEVAAQECVVLVADKSEKRLILSDFSFNFLSDISETKKAFAYLGNEMHEVTSIPYSKEELSMQSDFNTPKVGKLLAPQYSIKGISDHIQVGEYYPLEFQFEKFENVLYVPTECVQKKGSGKRQHAYVYIKEGSTFRQQEVTLGGETENFDAVIVGLKEGDVLSRPISNIVSISAPKDTIKKTDFTSILEISGGIGITYPIEKNEVVDCEGAILEKLFVEKGETVKKGQKLATLRVDTGKGQIAEIQNQIMTTRDSLDSEIRELEKQYHKKKNRMNEIALKQKKLDKNHQLEMLQNQLRDAQKVSGTITVHASISGKVDNLCNTKSGICINQGTVICSIIDETQVLCKVVDTNQSLHYGTQVMIYSDDKRETQEKYYGKVIFGNIMMSSLPLNFAETKEKSLSYVLLSQSDCRKVGKMKNPILRATGIHLGNALVVDRKAIFTDQATQQNFVWVWENNSYIKQYVSYFDSFRGDSGTKDKIVAWLFKGAKEGQQVGLDEKNAFDGKINTSDGQNEENAENAENSDDSGDPANETLDEEN